MSRNWKILFGLLLGKGSKKNVQIRLRKNKHDYQKQHREKII